MVFITKNAGTIAGLIVFRIFNELTTSVNSYGVDFNYRGHLCKERYVLILDFGGNTMRSWGSAS